MKRKIKLRVHRLRWKLDHAEPADVGFWFCMFGVAASFVVLYMVA